MLDKLTEFGERTKEMLLKKQHLTSSTKEPDVINQQNVHKPANHGLPAKFAKFGHLSVAFFPENQINKWYHQATLESLCAEPCSEEILWLWVARFPFILNGLPYSEPSPEKDWCFP